MGDLVSVATAVRENNISWGTLIKRAKAMNYKCGVVYASNGKPSKGLTQEQLDVILDFDPEKAVVKGIYLNHEQKYTGGYHASLTSQWQNDNYSRGLVTRITPYFGEYDNREWEV